MTVLGMVLYGLGGLVCIFAEWVPEWLLWTGCAVALFGMGLWSIGVLA